MHGHDVREGCAVLAERLTAAFAENIAAEEPARVAGCSRFALYRGFRTAYGLAAPSDYQRDLRLRPGCHHRVYRRSL
jgi:AraC-like DNA-binding protein